MHKTWGTWGILWVRSREDSEMTLELRLWVSGCDVVLSKLVTTSRYPGWG